MVLLIGLGSAADGLSVVMANETTGATGATCDRTVSRASVAPYP